jgi:hypothetical protein
MDDIIPFYIADRCSAESSDKTSSCYINDDSSDELSSVESVFSKPASLTSETSINSTIQQLGTDDIVACLVDDDIISDLFKTACLTIPANKLQRNFVRLLASYAVELRSAASGSLQQAVAFFVHKEHKAIAQRVRWRLDPGRES